MAVQWVTVWAHEHIFVVASAKVNAHPNHFFNSPRPAASPCQASAEWRKPVRYFFITVHRGSRCNPLCPVRLMAVTGAGMRCRLPPMHSNTKTIHSGFSHPGAFPETPVGVSPIATDGPTMHISSK